MCLASLLVVDGALGKAQKWKRHGWVGLSGLVSHVDLDLWEEIQALAKWVRSRVFYKKNAFFVFFVFFWLFLAVFGRGLVFFHVFWCFFCFFMVVLGTNASSGTKEALFFEYFWHSLFLRRLPVENFFVFFPHA